MEEVEQRLINGRSGKRPLPLKSKMGERTDNEGSVLLMRVSVLELLPDSAGCLRRTEEQRRKSNVRGHDSKLAAKRTKGVIITQ